MPTPDALMDGVAALYLSIVPFPDRYSGNTARREASTRILGV